MLKPVKGFGVPALSVLQVCALDFQNRDIFGHQEFSALSKGRRKKPEIRALLMSADPIQPLLAGWGQPWIWDA